MKRIPGARSDGPARRLGPAPTSTLLVLLLAGSLGLGLALPAAADSHEDDGWGDEVLYFVIVDRFADGDPDNNRNVDISAKGTFHGGDLIGLRERLDDLADLGVTALWITPVVKNIPGFVTGAGFPDWGYHGYWADDFYSLDPRFGSEEDLEALVDAAHERGIKVLLDVVYNHVGYDSRYTKDPATRAWIRASCGQDDLTTCVGGLPDLKTELPEVADYLFKAHIGLAERVGLDGFRIDTVKHVDHDFWQEHRRRLNEALGEEFFLLGEVWGGDARNLDPWFATDELDAGFDFGFQGSTLAFLQGRGRPIAFNRYLEKRHEVREGYHLGHYLSTHDVAGALFQLEGDIELFELAALLQLSVSGIPIIFYGEEVGRPGGDWPDNRSDMPWGDLGIKPGAGLPRNEELRSSYQRLIELRRGTPALWRGTHAGHHFDQDLLSFVRRDEATGQAVVVAVNRSAEQAAAMPPLEEWLGSEVKDLWNEETLEIAGAEATVTVPPRSARILTLE